MIHKIVFFLIIVILPSYLFGQFETNKHILGPSVGFSFLGSTTQVGLNHESGVLIRDLGIDEPGILSFGGIFRYWSYSENFPNIEWNYTDIVLGFQMNYHFSMSNIDVDPWFGIVGAYDFGYADAKFLDDITADSIDEDYGGLWLAVHAGARYWFDDKMAIGVSIGFGTLSYGAMDLRFDYKL